MSLHTPADPSRRLKAIMPPSEGECLALVWATQKFRQFLHGKRFTVRTDHAVPKWLATARFENSKLERWALRLQEFDFEVEYLPGEQNHLGNGTWLFLGRDLRPN
jgi:hypothetical protein